MYLTNASISALFRRIELFAALSGLFFAHNSLKINCFHHWDGLYLHGSDCLHLACCPVHPLSGHSDPCRVVFGWSKGPAVGSTCGSSTFCRALLPLLLYLYEAVCHHGLRFYRWVRSGIAGGSACRHKDSGCEPTLDTVLLDLPFIQLLFFDVRPLHGLENTIVISRSILFEDHGSLVRV